VLYSLVCGELPYNSQDDRELAARIKAGKFHMPARLSAPLKVRYLHGIECLSLTAYSRNCSHQCSIWTPSVAPVSPISCITRGYHRLRRCSHIRRHLSCAPPPTLMSVAAQSAPLQSMALICALRLLVVRPTLACGINCSDLPLPAKRDIVGLASVS
jgi:hypothetical protein